MAFPRLTGEGAERSGNEAGLWKGLVIILVPSLILAAGEYYLHTIGWRMAAYPLEFLLMVLLMGAPGWRAAPGGLQRILGQGATCSPLGITLWIFCRLRNGARQRRPMRCIWLCPRTLMVSVSRAFFSGRFLVCRWRYCGCLLCEGSCRVKGSLAAGGSETRVCRAGGDTQLASLTTTVLHVWSRR